MTRQNGTYSRLDRGARVAPPFARLCAAVAAVFTFTALCFAPNSAGAEVRTLKLYNLHTKERATIVYKRDGKYDRAGLAQVNQFLRDWRRNEPTKMDPNLLDLVWEVYDKSGSDGYINIICGYRSPATNGALRKRSKGVAKNSQHMRGKALDFFIEGVPLADLRAMGLRMQVGGVGYYPTSGSPFVHLDTGSVRHWPKMSRQQLAKVFPDGKTLHIPSNGKPLPGYAAALASHKLRGKAAAIEVASADDNESATARKTRKNVGEPVVVASAVDESDDEEFDAAQSAESTTASVATPLPRPRPAPTFDNLAPVIVATAEPLPAELQENTGPVQPIAAFASGDLGPSQPIQPRQPRPFEFESPSHWTSPSVPSDLARAMAARDVSKPVSLPIRPTAVVATVDVTRPLRAEAITTAVINRDAHPAMIRDVTPVFAYAAPMEATVPKPVRKAKMVSSDGVPVPVANPRLAVVTPVQPMATGSIEPSSPRELPAEDLTLTALDTLGLRLWIGDQSTRQKQYALLTMPDFSEIPSLLAKPDLAYSGGFGDGSHQALRTDRFSGPIVQLPTMIDPSSRGRLAFR